MAQRASHWRTARTRPSPQTPGIWSTQWIRKYRARMTCKGFRRGRSSKEVDLVDLNSDEEDFAAFLDAYDCARHVDARVVTCDVTEHETEGERLALGEPMGGFEANAVLAHVNGGSGSVRELDRELHVVTRRSAAVSADEGRRPYRVRTWPSHSS